jgi:hypothetical protein
MADLLFDDLVDGSGGLYFDDLSTAPTAPAILDVDTDEVLGAAQLGATFACLNGGATIGDRVLALVQGSTVVAQTQVAGNDTGGTFNVTGFGLNGLLKYGTATKARLTVGAAVAELDLATPSGQAVPFVPPTGRSWVQFGTLEATLEYRIEGVPVDIASGDQFEYVNQGGTVTVLDTGVVTGTTQAISSLTGCTRLARDGARTPRSSSRRSARGSTPNRRPPRPGPRRRYPA